MPQCPSRIALAVVALSTLFLVLPSQAVTIGSFSGGDVGEGLDLDGTFVYAVNIGPNANGGAPNQVRDAAFVADGFGDNPVGGQTSAQTGISIVATNRIGAGGWGNAEYGATSNDNNLEFVMESIRWDFPPGTAFNLPNLTVGDTYKLQLLFAENCCNRGFDVELEGATIAPGFVPRVTQGVANNSSMGAVVEETFVATDTVANIVLRSTGAFPDNNPILNGLTLEHLNANGPAKFQSIVVSSFTGGDVGEGLDLQGNFTHAVNVGGPSVAAGDVIFADGNPGNNPINAVVGANNHIPNWAPGANLGASADDDAIETVMQSIRWTANNQHDGNVSVHLSDLEPGALYKTQWIFSEACCNNRGIDVLLDGQVVLLGFSPGVAQGGATPNPTRGGLLTLIFQATDSMALIQFDGFAQATDQNPTLAGFTVERLAVPEPATGLLAMIAAGMLGRRRRRAA